MRITVEELLQRYAAGERDFRRVNLERMDLSGINLPGINLDRADLTGAVGDFDLGDFIGVGIILPNGEFLEATWEFIDRKWRSREN